MSLNALAGMLGRITDETERLIDVMLAEPGRADLHDAFALPLPVWG